MAPVGFLEIHREAIRGIEKDYESFFPDDFIGKRIEGRLRLAATPPAELLRRLDELPMECSVPRPSYPGDLVNEANKIIDILADIPAFRGELDEAPLRSHSPAPSLKIAEPFIAAPKTGRNDTCPCGSGKKFKKCCFTV